jgi:type IV secretory pathway TraG/TraD family ATPase VirD4
MNMRGFFSRRKPPGEAVASSDSTSSQSSGSQFTIYWGGLEIPSSEALNHFLAIGTTGSGKTTVLRLLMQSTLPYVGSGKGLRALVYDAKQDMLPVLSSFCQRSLINTLNPFDIRGVAWDMCRDITEPRIAVEFVFLLFPQQRADSQPFFADATRHVAYGVIISFMLSKVHWTFADLLRALRSARRLKAILSRHPETRHLVQLYFSDRRLRSNILSTIATKTLAYEPIAAAWESACESISLHQWAKEEMILVLGNSEISRTAIDAINRCIFKRASDIILAQPETFELRTLFYIDELSEAGRLDGLVPLMKKSRSKGGGVSISFQSISGLRDSRMYGPHFTDEILAQIGNRFIGRLECPETAEWASRVIGDQEINQYTTSESHSISSGQGGNSHSTSRAQTIVTRRAVLPSEFLSIAPCSRDNGLSGLFSVRSAGCYFATLDGEEVFGEQLIPPAADVPEFIPRPVEAQYLKPWTRAQAAKFGAIVPKRDRPAKKEPPDVCPDVDSLDGIEDL